MSIAHTSSDGATHPVLLSHSPNSKLIIDASNDLAEITTETAQNAQFSHEASLYHAAAVITKLEDVFESLLDCILDDKPLTIQLKRKAKVKQPLEAEDSRGDYDDKLVPVRFPTKSIQEARRFCALLNVLTVSHEALVTNVIVTKRDIYYRDPDLFIKQSLSDRCVDEVAYTLGIQRSSLNVVAAAKGLIAGALKVHTKDNAVIDYATVSEGYLIPNMRQVSQVEPDMLKWVMIIEKEATFRTLTTSEYWKNSTAGNGLLVTAKGYPDLHTRQFLHFLSSNNPKTPIFSLVDFDPDGIGIMSTYKHGSLNLIHEHNSTVPTIEWLGVRSRDFLRLNRAKEKQERDPQGLLQLSLRDRRIASNMLQREKILGEDGKEAAWRSEIQTMLMLNVKAEIQILGNGVRFEKWLDANLRAGRAAFRKKL